MWGTSRSRLFHSNSQCLRLSSLKTPIRTLSVSEARKKRPCSVCVVSQTVRCTVCDDAPAKPVHFDCGHSYCEECTIPLVMACSRQRKRITCTCVNRGCIDSIPSRLFDIYVSSPQDSDSSATSWSDELNLKCPHCDAVFYDFDGCAALQCECGGFFCAFCLEPGESSLHAHAHVKSCPFNPNPNQYYISETIEVISQRVKKKQATAKMIEYPNSLLRIGVAKEFAHLGTVPDVFVRDAATAFVCSLLALGWTIVQSMERIGHITHRAWQRMCHA